MLQVKSERLTEFYRLSDATFYDRIDTIYQFIKPFLDKECLFLRNMEAGHWIFVLITYCVFQMDMPDFPIGIGMIEDSSDSFHKGIPYLP